MFETLLIAGICASAAAQQPETIRRWAFDRNDDKQGWTDANGLRDVVVRDGVLRGIVAGRDPFIAVSDLDIPARPWNRFQARLRIVQDEPLLQREGELFYANSSEGPYGGFSQAKTGRWTAADANAWEVISIYPFWSSEGRITKLRLDFPVPAENQIDKAIVEVDWIEVSDLKLESQAEVRPSWTMEDDAQGAWESPLFNLDAERIGNWLTIGAVGGRCAFRGILVDERARCVLFDQPGTQEQCDGHLQRQSGRQQILAGPVHQFKLRVLPDAESTGTVTFQSLAVNSRPQGPAHIDVLFCGIEDAIVRAGYESAFFVDLLNGGGEDTPALALDNVRLPEGVALTAPAEDSADCTAPVRRKTADAVSGEGQ